MPGSCRGYRPADLAINAKDDDEWRPLRKAYEGQVFGTRCLPATTVQQGREDGADGPRVADAQPEPRFEEHDKRGDDQDQHSGVVVDNRGDDKEGEALPGFQRC